MDSYTRAIVRPPCRKFVNGLTTANSGKPDYRKALQQHAYYVNVLKKCGLEVIVLEPDDDYPDSTFVEDTALLTPYCAIITNPGALTRKGEIHEIRQVLKSYFKNIEHIKDPGTVDAGDILNVDMHFYIGISARTNRTGGLQILACLKKYGLTGYLVPVQNALHLKSGVAYLEQNVLVAASDFINKPEFAKFKIIEVEQDESYAANCLWINGIVLVARGFPKTKRAIENAGYKTIVVDVSEFRKLDGGLSCLSLRF